MIGKKLEYGDTIGVIAPASGEKDEIIHEKIHILKEMGFKVKEGKHLYNKLGYLAGEDKARAEDLMNAFIDTEVDAIICFRGGYGSMRILPYIDFKIIKANPKIFVGFSDITVFLNNFYFKSDLITFHGPMVSSNLEDMYTKDSLLNTLMNNNKTFTIKNPNDCPFNYIGNESMEGIVVGGNLSLICSTLGTEYEIDTENKILFLEEVNEEPYAIDRMLTQLKLCNKLQKCNGFILGQFKGCDTFEEPSLSLDEVIKEGLLNLNKPSIVNFMAGHGSPRLTLPIGAKIKASPNKNELDVLEPVVF